MTAPSSYVALANGAHVATKVNANGTSTTHYSLQFPCPSYLICFAVGEFIEVDDGVCEGMPLKYFAPKGTDPKDVFRAFDKTRSMILWMTKKLGVKFPWPKYYQISAPHVRGAMENISLVTWSEMYLMDETWAKERKVCFIAGRYLILADPNLRLSALDRLCRAPRDGPLILRRLCGYPTL